MAETELDANVAKAHKLPGTDNPVTDSSLASAGGSPSLASASGASDQAATNPMGSVDGETPIPPVLSKNRWLPEGEKITIASLDMTEFTISAQYNPKELQVDRPIPWQFQRSPALNRLVLEFSGEDARTLNLELLFDGYEEGESIADAVQMLEMMSRANIDVKKQLGQPQPSDWVVEYDKKKDEPGFKREPKPRKVESPDGKTDPDVITKRPHYCFITWGDWWRDDPLKVVIENISTKYTMFSDQGAPLRALVSLRLKEAHGVTIARPADLRARADIEVAAKSAGPLDAKKAAEDAKPKKETP